jgi:hypothetical protein
MDGPVADVIRAILLLGMALLAWRELSRIRAEMAERKRRKQDDSSQD